MTAKLLVRMIAGTLGLFGIFTSAQATVMQLTLPSLSGSPLSVNSFSTNMLNYVYGALVVDQTSTMSNFSFTHTPDSSSISLQNAAINGTFFPTASLQYCDPDCSTPTKEFSLTFTDGLISSYALVGSVDTGIDHITFTFESVVSKYSVNDPSVLGTYDVKKKEHPWSVLMPFVLPAGAISPYDLPIAMDFVTLSDRVDGPGSDLGIYVPDTLFNTLYSQSVPEPETYTLLCVGLGLMAWVGRRKK